MHTNKHANKKAEIYKTDFLGEEKTQMHTLIIQFTQQ